MSIFFITILKVLQNLSNFDSTSISLQLVESLNEIVSCSPDELDFFYESGGLDLILKLLSTDNKLDYTCLKLLLYASKRNEKFRKELLKGDVFHLLSVHLKRESNLLSKKSLVLYATLITVLVHGNEDAQDQIRRSGCLAYLVYVLNNFLVGVERKPLSYKSVELLVCSIIACNKDPRNVENQTEVGWITPKIVEYLGKQTIFSGGDQIQIMKCFWSFLKSILHKNEFNQQVFLRCSGFPVLFRSMQEIVDENKSDEFGDLLIKMTGVLVRLKSQKEFLCLASTYCSLMILRNLLNTSNVWVIQYVIIFLDSLTQEIPHALQPARNKQILQSLLRAKIILSESELAGELCQSIWERTVASSGIPHGYNANPADAGSVSKSHAPSELGSWKAQFCVIHGSDALEMTHVHSDYFFDAHNRGESSERSKSNGSDRVNVYLVQLRNRLKERKALKLGQISRHGGRKSCSTTRMTVRKIIRFFGKLRSFFCQI